MAVNFSKETDLLRQELDSFYTTTRRGDDPRPVLSRLCAAVRRAETVVAAAPGGWSDPNIPRRWGYVRLVSVIKAAQYELQHFEEGSEGRHCQKEARAEDRRRGPL